MLFNHLEKLAIYAAVDFDCLIRDFLFMQCQTVEELVTLFPLNVITWKSKIDILKQRNHHLKNNVFLKLLTCLRCLHNTVIYITQM